MWELYSLGTLTNYIVVDSSYCPELQKISLTKIFSLYVIQCIWSLVKHYFFLIIINESWLMTNFPFLAMPLFGWVNKIDKIILSYWKVESWAMKKRYAMWLALHGVAMTTILVRWYIMIVHPSIHSKLCDSRVWVKRIQV